MPRCSAVESRGLPHAAWLRCRDGWQPCCGDAHAVGDERPLRVRKCRQLHRHVLQVCQTISSHAHERVHMNARAQPCVCVRVLRLCARMRVRLHTSSLGHAALGALHHPPVSFRPSVPPPAPAHICAGIAPDRPHLRRGLQGRRAFPNDGLSLRRRADASTFRVLHPTASHRIGSHAAVHACVRSRVRAFTRVSVLACVPP